MADDNEYPHDEEESSRPLEEERLLTNWEKEAETEDENEELSALPASVSGTGQRHIRGRWILITLGFCTLALIASVGILLSLTRAIGEDQATTNPVKLPNDYVLDEGWDFDAGPRRRIFRWTIRDNVHNPDGVYRSMILINNQFPGPLIRANEGDTIVVHIDNQAVNATSIHWHGIYQRGTPEMDGTVGVTQCPIPPGGKFTYEFIVSGQRGTYWYHAHYGVQAADGLHGPMIIHGRNERQMQKLDYATDQVILISDHYHDLSSALLWQYLKPDMENAEPVPNSGLINGVNVLECDEFPGRKCDNGTSNVGIPTIHLAKGQKHRLRLINVGVFAEFQIQIDEHELAVTEVDGTDVLPVNYHRISINPAQRYSAVVGAGISTADAFWLRARMVATCFADPPANLQTEVRAVVRYARESENPSDDMPTSKDWADMPEIDCKDMNITELRPVEANQAPQKTDAFFYLRSNFEIGAYRLSRGFFNESSWRPNIRSPTLLRSIDGMAVQNRSFSHVGDHAAAFVNDAAFDINNELVIQTSGVQTIDVLISNFDDGNHPLHLHGYKYFVLAEGDGYPPLVYPGADINPETLAPLYESLDLSNPLRRDTASVQAFGWILIRFIADNPGAWAFHCHVNWHTEAGLLMQFLTRSDDLAHMTVSDASSALCLAAGLDKGAGPEDAVYEDLA